MCVCVCFHFPDLSRIFLPIMGFFPVLDSSHTGLIEPPELPPPTPCPGMSLKPVPILLTLKY